MPSIGDSVTCAETGRVFTIARDGYSYNYATTLAGEILSDLGVDRAPELTRARQRAPELTRARQRWYGRGSEGICITLRPLKG